jgi:hypothetical protein
MQKMKSNKYKMSVLVIVILAILIVIYFYPFKLANQYCGESPLCKVKFGVYVYSDDAETGERYFGKNMQIGEKVGGILEYLGLKKIDCVTK